jgi:tRNA A-37 threonylcarbamoyl transferase component Bud32
MTTNSIPSSCCPRCGSPISDTAPGGQCPQCLLRAVLTPTEPAPPPADARDWPTLAEVAAAFPDLQVEREIGHGGMAVVFKARQPHLDRLIALKILASWLANEPGFADRFSREARVLAKLNHPNIVTIHDFGQAGRFYYLVMEFVDGVNLRQAMQAQRFSPAQALELVPKLCDALQYAHGEGILHRDIKPDNILLDTKGRVKIADFGIAKLAGEPESQPLLTRSGMHLGTPAYMAPEQLENPGEVDHRADIYSLGVVLYEMLTGELPLGRFAAPSAKSAVDDRIDEIVFRTLEKERERRYQSAGEVKTRVEGLGDSPPSPPAAPVAATGAAGPRPLVKRAFAGALCTAVSLVAAVVMVASWIFIDGVQRTGPYDAPEASPSWVGLLALAATVIGICGPGIAGFFLGASGLLAIRQSGGSRSGAGFGAFATLAWPLLLLTWIIVAGAAVLGGAIFGDSFRPTVGGWLMAATVLAGVAGALWLDYRILRATLRWARGQGEAAA